jgi:hypothetical protein
MFSYLKQEFGDRFDFGTGFLLSQTICLRVEQNFSFFWRYFLLEGRIFNSKYLCCWDVRQVYQIVVAEVFSPLPLGAP